MTIPPPVRWGVLAPTARIARLAVLPALEASPKCEVVATASQSRGESYDQLLDDPEVEVVYIPLPNNLHAEWTMRAAAAGKHVLCEKPLACSADEARDMALACQKAGVLLMEAYMTPFHPRSAMVADVLRSGRLGSLRFGRTAFTGVLEPPDDHRWRPEMGGGALLDVGIYCVAPLLMAAARPPIGISAAAAVTEGGVDSSCSGWFDFGSGFTAAFECSFEAPERQAVEFVGTDAVLTLERSFTPSLPDTTISLLTRDGQREVLEAQPGDPYRGMVDHVATVIRGGDQLRRRPADSIALLEVLDRVRAAAGLP